jgi:hypothetical protein
MVHPTLLASIGTVALPSCRGVAVGVYRLWRDLGYAISAAVAGVALTTTRYLAGSGVPKSRHCSRAH